MNYLWNLSSDAPRPRSAGLAICMALALLLVLSGCNLRQASPEQAAAQTEVRATELELHVQQTLVAQQATAQGPAMTRQAERATHRAQTAQVTQAPDAPGPTPRPVEASPTATSEPAATTEPAATAAQPEPSAAPAGLDDAALQERIQAANILLYEDMVSRNNTNRVVKDTLARMELQFKDDGNASGWLVDDLKNGAPGGEPWDLVILALEDKTASQSAFFTYAMQALDAGSSVIMEVWFLNATYNAGGRVFLNRCGLEYQGNRIKIAPANMGLFAMDPAHPLLNEPNTGISLSKTNNYWWDPSGRIDYDTGDLLRLAPDSRAQLVIGAQPNNPNDHATLAVCEGGRLTLQTFSSHTLTYNNMTLLWENYIYNALKARFEVGE